MRWFMGKMERELTDQLRGAHGGSHEQYRRVRETLRYVPDGPRGRVDALLDEVFLELKIPWTSDQRLAALSELVELVGGYPHALQALLEYWPVAKSARMTGWAEPS